MDEAEPARATSPSTGRTPVTIAFFAVIFIASLLAFFYLFRDFVADFLLAFMLTGIFRPLYVRASARFKRPAVASALVTSLIAVLVAIPLTFLIASLSNEAAAFYQRTLRGLSVERLEAFLFGAGFWPEKLRLVTSTLGIDWSPEVVRTAVTKASGTVAAFLYERINHLVGNLVSGLFHFVIILVVVFYLLIDGDRLRRFVFELSPLPADEEELLAKKFDDVARASLFGNGIASGLQGFIGGVSMLFVGLPSPILWGTVMAVFAFLPLVGISIVTIPAAVYLLVEDRPWAAAIFFAFNALQSVLVENVLKTRLMGSHMQMHDLLIFLSVIGGIASFGILGIVYGPLVVSLVLTLSELYHRRYRQIRAT